jgi:hypothetical protein
VYLLRLEGLFRELPCGTLRLQPALLQAIKDIFHNQTEATVFAKLVDNSIFNKGDGHLRKSAAGKGKGDGEGKGEGGGGVGPGALEADPLVFDAPAPAISPISNMGMWNIIVAQTMCKVASAMQKEILEGKLIAYFTEWCNTVSPRVAGVSYRDYIVVYDRNGDPTQYLQRRSPLNNIYIGIDADYLGFDPDVLVGELYDDMSDNDLCDVLRGVDPTLVAHIDRYTEAMSRTFWACYDGFLVQQACEVNVYIIFLF